MTLLEEGWKDIFILTAAQFQMPIDIAPLMANAGLTPDTTAPEKLIKLMTEMHNFQDIMTKFKQAQVDNNEYSFLKCISLFKTSKF